MTTRRSTHLVDLVIILGSFAIILNSVSLFKESTTYRAAIETLRSPHDVEIAESELLDPTLYSPIHSVGRGEQRRANVAMFVAPGSLPNAFMRVGSLTRQARLADVVAFAVYVIGAVDAATLPRSDDVDVYQVADLRRFEWQTGIKALPTTVVIESKRVVAAAIGLPEQDMIGAAVDRARTARSALFWPSRPTELTSIVPVRSGLNTTPVAR